MVCDFCIHQMSYYGDLCVYACLVWQFMLTFWFILLIHFKPCVTIIQGVQIGATTSMYLLCCILRILKTKDLANSIAGSLFCPFDAFNLKSESKLNGHVLSSSISEDVEEVAGDSANRMAETSYSKKSLSISSEYQALSGHLDSINHFTQCHSLRYIWEFLQTILLPNFEIVVFDLFIL